MNKKLKFIQYFDVGLLKNTIIYADISYVSSDMIVLLLLLVSAGSGYERSAPLLSQYDVSDGGCWRQHDFRLCHFRRRYGHYLNLLLFAFSLATSSPILKPILTFLSAEVSCIASEGFGLSHTFSLTRLEIC